MSKYQILREIKVGERQVCHKYRLYNAAFFEEIILVEQIEERAAKNYRERFLIDKEAIFDVLKMYATKDYLQHFL